MPAGAGEVAIDEASAGFGFGEVQLVGGGFVGGEEGGELGGGLGEGLILVLEGLLGCDFVGEFLFFDGVGGSIGGDGFGRGGLEGGDGLEGCAQSVDGPPAGQAPGVFQ